MNSVQSAPAREQAIEDTVGYSKRFFGKTSVEELRVTTVNPRNIQRTDGRQSRTPTRIHRKTRPGSSKFGRGIKQFCEWCSLVLALGETVGFMTDYPTMEKLETTLRQAACGRLVT
jgi:hypothetical protein